MRSLRFFSLSVDTLCAGAVGAGRRMVAAAGGSIASMFATGVFAASVSLGAETGAGAAASGFLYLENIPDRLLKRRFQLAGLAR